MIGGDAIELPGWLVIPGVPDFPAVERNDRTLVGPHDDAGGIFRRNPKDVIVFTAGRPFPGDEVASAVGGTVGGGLHHVNDIGILRIGKDPAKILGADYASILGDLLPAFSRVVGAEEALMHQREDPLAGGPSSHRNADPAAV